MYILKSRVDLYALKFFIFLLFLIISSGVLFYNLLPNTKFSVNIFIPINKYMQKVYLLESNDTLTHLDLLGYDKNEYLRRLNDFKKRLQKIGIEVKTINEKDINSLTSLDTLLALDIFALSKESRNKIINFLKKGGNLLFNYNFAYFQEKKYYTGSNLIKEITGLDYVYDIKPQKGLFFTPKILSPIMLSSENSKRYDLIIYDPIPLFSSKNRAPDAILTNWEITSTPSIDNEPIPLENAGVIWHGMYGKGSWIYCSFPLYSFLDMSIDDFSLLISNMINYLNDAISIAKYPYIDIKKAIFISEDTEYKYENMINYAHLAQKYKIDTTLFCVASLAEKHKKITKEASSLSHIEIASHSYSHRKIVGENDEIIKKEIVHSKDVLEEIIEKKIYGFRPPREEIDKKMAYWLKEAKYTYVMEKSKSYLLPKEEIYGLITIPRHGTDDYIYLINLDWSENEILNRIIYETNLLTSLNALYTLSIHTHLLSYSNNINVIRKFFEYLSKRKDIKPLKGKELAKRAKLFKNIHLSYTRTMTKLLIAIENNNYKEVKNFTFRVYWHNLKNIGDVKSEILNIKAEEIKRNNNEKFSDIRVQKLKPNYKLTLILPYNE